MMPVGAILGLDKPVICWMSVTSPEPSIDYPYIAGVFREEFAHAQGIHRREYQRHRPGRL